MSDSLASLRLVNCASQSDLLQRVDDLWSGNSSFAIATLNLDHVVKLRQPGAFLDAYRRQTIVVADGNPIVWMRRLMGQPVDLIPGSDLIAPLAELAGARNMPVALFGSDQPTLDQAADWLQHRFQGLRVVSKIAPPQGFDPLGAEAAVLLEQLRDSGARLCFLALGAPKQEVLAARAIEVVPGCGFVSIGAGLDFIAGSQRRAPLWVRRIAMEWLWRLGTNPGRLARRYAQCAVVLARLAPLAWISGRNRRGA